MQIQYVLTYVLDESKENVLCLIKESGPAFLIGKINVPGGKIEPKESLQSACSRELFEETGLSIDSKKWINFETYISEEFILYKFCSKIPKSELNKAYTKEKEIIFVDSIKNLRERNAQSPNDFNDDFWFDIHKIEKFY